MNLGRERWRLAGQTITWGRANDKAKAEDEERRNPGRGGLDWSVPKIGPWFLFTHVVVASLDVGRLQWSNVVPLWLQVVGLVGFGMSVAMLIWAMSVNRFFSPVVRIQSERGHRIVTDGPYRYVRHPGYTAMLLLGPASCLALGSLLAFFPVVAWMVLIIRRTVIEDRVLRESLSGYREYADRVRYRLAPQIW